MSNTWKVAAFYRFFKNRDCEAQAEAIRAYGESRQLGGTVLLAPEGINSTVAGAEPDLDAFLQFLIQDRGIPLEEVKLSWSHTRPFPRFKVKIKKEIVTFRQPDLNPEDPSRIGTYVEPADWNSLIRDPEVTLVDTRNDYEYKIGHFPGAINPRTEDFTAFADWARQNLDARKQKKVAMYCTGGIRCEKATALLKQEGFEEVYHLQGGILKYLEETRSQDNQWKGDCFVFDYRVAVDSKLQPAGWHICPYCHEPAKGTCQCQVPKE